MDKGRSWLPARRRRELRYRDPSQMGKVYLLPAGVTRPVTGLTTPSRGRTRTSRS